MKINDIFAKEEKVITQAEQILKSEAFTATECAGYYGELLDEYRKLLKQMRSVVKMSDITQGKLNSLSMELERLSNIDELTDLYNRRCFNEKIAKEWFYASVSQSSLGLLMIDIDYFKQYNDNYGHLQGDKCLKEIADTIRQTVNRPKDFVARYGGEEFIVLLPGADLAGCAYIADRILENVTKIEFTDVNNNSYGKVTVSIGGNSMVPCENIEIGILISGADRALYKAKKEGRHCYRSI
jgi:diguanylate cyclase (GGDEF) domain